MEPVVESTSEINGKTKEVQKAETKKLEMELAGVGVDLSKGVLQYMDVNELDYRDKWNVRDPGLYPQRVATKLAELETDQMIRTPLVVARLVGMAPNSKPIVISGHVRCRALAQMAALRPELYNAKFQGKIPVIVLEGITEEQRRRLVLDHGSEIQLDESEVAQEQWRLMRAYPGQRRLICNMLSRCYFQLADAASRTIYNVKLQEFRENGFVKSGQQRFDTLQKVIENVWKGRYQKYQRLVEAPENVRLEWLRACSGDATATKGISGKFLETLCKSTSEQAEALMTTKRSDVEEKRDKRTLIWGPARLIAAKSVCKSHYYMTQLNAALGDAEAARSLPGLEEELVKIEAAIAKNPEFFWNTITELLAD